MVIILKPRKTISYITLIILTLFMMGISKASSTVVFYYYSPDSPQNNLSSLKRDMDVGLQALPQTISFQPFARFDNFDTFIRKNKPTLVYVPYWYLETFGNELNIEPLFYSIRNNKRYYKKNIIANKKSNLTITTLKQKTFALTTMGPQSESILNRILLKKHKIKANELRLVNIPKDTDAIFAVALGQVDSAFVAAISLERLKQINPRLTSTVQTIATSEKINLPVLCYLKDTISTKELEKLKQQLLKLSKQKDKMIFNALSIDAWEVVK